MKKVAVLGAGSSGIQSVCHLLTYLPSDWEITLIHNPNIPIFGIGESTNGTFINAISMALRINLEKDLAELDGTMKYSTHYVDWREYEFDGPLLMGNSAIHFNTYKLNDFALPRLHTYWSNKFKEICGNATEIINTPHSATVIVDGSELVFDYVMDNRGRPTSFDDYWKPETPTVNRALIHNAEGNGTNWGYTVHKATEDGWMFQVPLTTRISNGYLFNDTITDIETAKLNFSKHINVPVDQLEKIEYKFNPYYAKELVVNRVIKNGNRAMFFEPMFANSLWNYDRINRLFFDYIQDNNATQANLGFIRHVMNLKDMFYFKYHGGSIYNSKFWNTIKQQSTEKLMESLKFHETILEMKEINRIGKGETFWNYASAGLNIVDKVFGYNYFKIDIDKQL